MTLMTSADKRFLAGGEADARNYHSPLAQARKDVTSRVAYHGILAIKDSVPATRLQERIRRIASRQNSLLQAMRRSFHHAELTADGACAVESVRLIEEAIRSGLKLRAVVFSDTGLRHAEKLLSQVPAKTELVSVTDEIFRGVVETEAPQGVAALVQMRDFTMADLLSGTTPLVIVASGIQDPGNLGTVIRSAEAFGANGVLMTEGTVSRFNAKAIRASAGSIFRLPSLSIGSEEGFTALGTQGLRLIGATSHKGTPLDKANLASAVAIVIGNEGAGLPKKILDALDERITIPHSSKVESLNAGVAASVILYEAARQRRTRP